MCPYYRSIERHGAGGGHHWCGLGAGGLASGSVGCVQHSPAPASGIASGRAGSTRGWCPGLASSCRIAFRPGTCASDCVGDILTRSSVSSGTSMAWSSAFECGTELGEKCAASCLRHCDAGVSNNPFAPTAGQAHADRPRRSSSVWRCLLTKPQGFAPDGFQQAVGNMARLRTRTTQPD